MVVDVTVVTPTTGRDTLAQCEASVKAQTVPCVHAVMHNNAGDYGNSARNQGVAESSTPYIAMLDDDDWYEPQFAEVMLAALKETGADMVYSRARLWGKSTGAHLGSWFIPFDAALLARVPYIATCTILGKRKVFESCPYESASDAYNADWRMYLSAIDKGFGIVSIDVELSNYRTSAGAWSQWAAGGLTPAGVMA
jgi:glycosyltransferase involved in cell wall biosynthesis